MAMRRPRIKAAANLVNVKRKPKAPVVTPNVDTTKNDIKDDVVQLPVQSEKENIKDTTTEATEISKTSSPVIDNSDTICIDNISNLNDPKLNASTSENIESNSSAKETVLLVSEDALPSSNEIAFKQPTIKENYRQTSGLPLGSPFNNFGSVASYKSEDGYHSDIDNNIMHMDLQRNANGFPMSPTKQQPRPRIRPSPIIGQRRNSYVGCSPSPHTVSGAYEESSNEFIMPSPRRERYNSASLSFGNSVASPHKYMPMLNSRTRTDSNCSAFSDILSSPQISANPLMLTKIRKPNTSEVSNNRANWLKDYESRCPNGVPDKARLKMLDLIYYNPLTNPMDIKHNSSNNNNNNSIDNSIKETKIEESSEKKQTSVPVPQLKLNANNELVLDDKSLEIETTAEQEARKLLSNTSLVFVDENTGTNGFYRRQKRTKEWPHEETIKFYRCLQTVGTDFSLMVQLFPTRNRRDLKLKFKKEERNNGALINKAILYPKNFDIDQLQQQLEEDERKRDEDLRKWREIEAKAAVKIQKLNVKTISERVLQNGVDIYENELVPKKQLSKRAKKISPKKPSENLEEKGNVDEEPIEETNKILNHIGKSVESREQENYFIKTETINKLPKCKKPRSDIELLKNNNSRDKKVTKPRKKKIKMENNEVNNDIINVEIDNKQLESELDELLQNDDVPQQQPQPPQTPEAQLGKTIMDLDNGQAIHILPHEEYKPEGACENITASQIKIDKDTFFEIAETRTLTTSPKELMSENNGVYSIADDSFEATTTVAAAEPSSTDNDISLKSDVNVVNDQADLPLKTDVDVVDDQADLSLKSDVVVVENQVDLSLKSDVVVGNQVDLSLKSDVDIVGDQEGDEEETILRIMQQIDEGGLMLVSSIDPNNLDSLINEIYMIDKNTGDLCAQPLDLPEDIVQAIVDLAT